MIREKENGDYDTAYSEISGLVQKADIAFINQETLLAGEKFGFSGYPLFNTPQKIGKALVTAGFSVINHATNHVMDKGEKAVLATLDYWDTFPELTILGVHRGEEEKRIPKLVKKNNITTGFLSYSYGTNGLPVPKNSSFLVSLINTEIMEKEIDALRPLCDFLVVSMHWGEEYKASTIKEQDDLADFLAEHKVDLVIGHHPHVIQPVKFLLRPDGRYMLTFYSLGNLISAQTQTPALLGALAYIKIKKTGARGAEINNESITIIDAGAIPIVTHYEKGFENFKVYPLYSYSKELAEKHWKNQLKKELTIEDFDYTAEKVLENFRINRNPFPANVIY
jgi:poly-gamma-glutamate synthesis protein (capsule biosynthesis protein)